MALLAPPPAGTHTITLTWNPSTDVVTGYNPYVGNQTGGPYVLATPAATSPLATACSASNLPGCTMTLTGIVPGNYFIVITAAIVSGTPPNLVVVESVFSNEAIVKVAPAAATGLKVTGTT
jgi:hypothetical protein